MSNEPITIYQAEQKDQQRWDAYVLSHPDVSPYHLFAWKLAVEESYSHRCYYLCAEIKDQLVGILPLVRLYFPGILDELTALPYCDVGNCLCDNNAVQEALLGKALSIKNELNCNKLQLRGPLRETELKNAEFYADNRGKVRMLLELPSSSEELFSSFKSKLRSQIRKAEKNGIDFRWSGSEDMNTIYSIFSRNMHDLGSPVHAKRWLQNVLKFYAQRVKVGLVEFEGKAVGIGIILLAGQNVSIPWASTLREYNRLGPNMFLYWNFLKFSADNCYTVFDFGRSTEEEGTYRFKKQWGAQPVPLIWYNDVEERKNDDQVKQQTDKRGMAADIWQKIPLPVANIIGPRLRKYISL